MSADSPRLATLEVETFWALALDSRSLLIGEPIRLSIGDVDGCDAGPRSFIRAVVRRGATSAIAVHNHPTGDPGPSGLRQAECNISDAPECRIQGGMTKVWQRHIEEVPTQKTAFRGKDMWQDFWRRPLAPRISP